MLNVDDGSRTPHLALAKAKAWDTNAFFLHKIPSPNKSLTEIKLMKLYGVKRVFTVGSQMLPHLTYTITSYYR